MGEGENEVTHNNGYKYLSSGCRNILISFQTGGQWVDVKVREMLVSLGRYPLGQCLFGCSQLDGQPLTASQLEHTFSPLQFFHSFDVSFWHVSLIGYLLGILAMLFYREIF